MRTAYRCRAYPDEAQQAMLARTFGCVRVVWNRVLAERHQLYRAEGKSLSYAASDRALTAMKKEPDLAFLNEVSSVPLQQTLRHQQKAFAAFFARRAGYPRFMSRCRRQSATYTRSAFSMRDGMLLLAKTSGPLRFVWTWREVDVTLLDPTSLTVTRDPAGRWFVTFHVDAPDPGNCAKARKKVARVHARITDARRDFLHKASTGLVQRFDLIAVEDLNVAGMVLNRSLARTISCAGWAGFRSMLEYKAERCGRTVAAVDRWYPSSKTCSTCGCLLSSLSLGTRHWTCPGCGTLHDRDINAAKNILAAGLAATACGGDVRRIGTTRAQSPVKQEPRPAREGIPGRSSREDCQRTRLHTGAASWCEG